MSEAARTARRASSSWSCGIPNTAITASPMNFSTVPPWRSSTARISSKYRVMTRRSDSGSSFSPRDVDPVTSVNTTVTVLRTSRASAEGAESSAPHAKQNRAMSGLSWPQLGHDGMGEGYGLEPGPYRPARRGLKRAR